MSYISLRSVRRLAGFVVLFAFAFSVTAYAAPTSVNIRVEGSTSTLFEGAVSTDTNKPDGVYACNGPSPTSALFDMTQNTGIAFAATWYEGGINDYSIDQIGSDIAGPTNGGYAWWSLWVNNTFSSVGGCQVILSHTDQALWAFIDEQDNILGISVPAVVKVGETFQAEVKKHDMQGTSSPAQEASLSVGGQSYTTDGNGQAAVTISSEGSYSYKAELQGSVRSNAATTCAYVPGSGFCNTVKADAMIDRIAPSIRVLWPKKKRYRRRGPRVLKGYVEADPSGLKAVKIRLKKKTGRKDRRCRGFNFKRERFSIRCSKAAYKKVGNKSSWSYQLPKALGPGLYRLEVKAIDGAGNVSKLSFGQSRVHFRVLNRRK